MHEYSCTIYPLFLWYAYSAQLSSENVFPLIDFKSAVRIGYLDLADNGEKRSNGSGATWPNARRCSAGATRR